MALMLALFAAACGESKDDSSDSGGGTASNGKDCGKVVLNEQAWAGSTANTYIAKAVLEDQLGCEVEITKIAEIPVFQAMADGKVDAVLEDWQHVDEYAKYIDKGGTVVQGGPLGVEGHIGWFIPKYLMDEHPEFKTWEGLKGKEDLFKTAESGDQGMFLGGDPSYVQKDKELIEDARAQLQARDRRRRAGPGGALEPALQAEGAGDLLLVHAAVPQPGVRPGRGQAAAAHGTPTRTARTTPRRVATPSSTSASTT